MNEGIAKALRRQARSQGLQSTAPGRGTVIPGKETKPLWSSLSHRQRGEWRSKLPSTRAARKRQFVRLASVRLSQREERALQARLRRIKMSTGEVIVYRPGSVAYADGI